MELEKPQFALGEKVLMDGDHAIVGTVVAIRFFMPTPEYLVYWFSHGDAKSDWFAEWRVKAGA